MFNRRDSENDIGVAISPRNFQGTPQYDEFEFFRVDLIILAVCSGLVVILLKLEKQCFCSNSGTSSSDPGTVDFLAKCWFKILPCCLGSLTIKPFSRRGGIGENFWLFKSFVRIQNFFLAEIS